MVTRQPAGVLRMAPGNRQNLKPERQRRRDDRPVEAKLADRPLDRDLPYGCRADKDLVALVGNCCRQRPRESRCSCRSTTIYAYRSEPSRRLLEIFLYFGRQRSIKILGNVGDPQQVLSAAALFSRWLIGNQLGFWFACLGDDDFLAGGAVDQLGEVGFRIIDVDGISHYRFGAALHKLTRLTSI